MKQSLFFQLLVVISLGLSLPFHVLSQSFQKTYSSGIDRDHYSIVQSGSTPGNMVLAGTEESFMDDRQIHAMEIDGSGNVVWEKRYDFSGNEQAFDITQTSFGYAITGVIQIDNLNEILLLLIDYTGNIIDQRNYNANIPESDTTYHFYGVHILETTNDPIPGYLITGMATERNDLESDKMGIVMKINNAFGVQWMVRTNSILVDRIDYDMSSRATEIPGRGYFISGSANGVGIGNLQTAHALMLDYNGSKLWLKNYGVTTGASTTHYYSSNGAIYDDLTGEIYQLGNLSDKHEFFVRVFDVNGMEQVNKSKWFSSTLGGASFKNIFGFEIIEDHNPENYCIAGLAKNHSWVDDNGIAQQGSSLFVVRVEKATGNVLDEMLYNIPSIQYFNHVDLFSAFGNSGYQADFYTPQMFVKEGNGNGFVLSTVRKEMGNVFDLEVIGASNTFQNSCERDMPNFETHPLSVTDSKGGISALFSKMEKHTMITNSFPSVSGNCESPESCTPRAEFKYVTNKCNVTFTDASSGQNLGCYFWDFGDQTTSTSANPTHTYTSPGTYVVTLTVCCEINGVQFYDVYTENVTVNCLIQLIDPKRTTSGDINLYPNPATNLLTITWDKDVSEIEIYGCEGKPLKQIETSELRSVQVDVNDLPAGMYFVKIGNTIRHFSINR